MIDLKMWGHYCQECGSLYEDHTFEHDLCPYPAKTKFVAFQQMASSQDELGNYWEVQ